MAQFKLILSDWRMVYSSYILKYRSGNLIIFYCCVYSGLLGTVGVVIQTP